MTSLLTRLEQAEEGDQKEFIFECLHLVYGQGWLEHDTYTKALDWVRAGAFESAALTLVPEGQQWSIHFYRGGLIPEEPNGWFLGEVDGISGGVIYEGKSYATPALALCIAALKARQAQERAA